jgi:hypothetical protein
LDIPCPSVILWHRERREARTAPAIHFFGNLL